MKRILSIDVLKCISIYLVILGHLLPESKIFGWIYGFHVPLFFFLSGLLDKKHNITQYIKRLILPYVSLNLIYMIVEIPWKLLKKQNISFVFNDLISLIPSSTHPTPINYPLWFLLVLFLIKTTMNVIHRDSRLLFMTALFSILTIYYNNNIWISMFLTGYIHYLCGYCFKSIIGQTINIHSNNLFYIYSIIGLVLFSIYTITSCYTFIPSWHAFHTCWYSILLTYSMIIGLVFLSNSILTRFNIWGGKT